MNPKVDEFISNAHNWQEEMAQLRAIVLECELIEELKWGVPCYSYQGSNVLIIHGFKEYCALNFFNGVLLNDSEAILIQQTKNVQTARQIRFKYVSEIVKMIPVLKAYIFEAIEVEKAGLKVELKKTSDFDVPEELLQKFNGHPDFKTAFEALTPGRQKGYLLHFAQPKQSKSRVSRIEKNTERILNGKGIRDCICGHSKRMPNCDGSHKNYE